MAGYDETVILGPAVQRMALAEGSGAKGKECARENALDFQMEVEAMIDQVRRLRRDRPKHFAAGAREFRLLLDEIQTEKMDKAPVDAVDKIQMEKMDRAPVDKIQMEKMDKALVVDGEEAPVDKIQMEKMDKVPVGGENETGKETMETGCCDDSGGEKYRLPDDLVRSILACKRTRPHAEIPFLQTPPNLADLLGVTDESLQVHRDRFFGEEADRSKRINDNFELFQDKIRGEWEREGFVEVDDEYLDNVAKMQALHEELWKDYDWTGFEFSDPDDPDYACWYEPAKEELCTVK